jgi:hypothetical protein
MEQTRYEYLSVSDQTQELPAPPLEKAASKESLTIPLPRPEYIQVPPLDLRIAVERRRSIRSRKKNLHSCAGVRRVSSM